MSHIKDCSYLYIDIKISANDTLIWRYHDIAVMSIFEETKTGKQQPTVQGRRGSVRHVILVLDNIVHYNRVKELGDLVKYHSKLMSYYGFDVSTGKWDSKLFPVTQSDAHLEGVQSDIERYNNAVRDYNKYAEHLAKEFCIDIYDEMNKGHTVAFHPPTSDITTPA